MKTLFRILVILVVASLVGGAIFAAVNGGGTSSQGNSIQREDGRERPDGNERDQSSLLFLPFGMIKNLIVIAIIATVYLNAGKWLSKGKATKRISA